MKVVLIKIPKVFGGILRLIFGIKKHNEYYIMVIYFRMAVNYG